MKDKFATEQEAFWAGSFGDAYSARNVGEGWIAANTALFSRVLERTRGVTSVVEFGANIGLNLRSLAHLLPASELAAVEINATAVANLREWGRCDVYEASMLDVSLTRQWDLALVKGVLIHVDPGSLSAAYQAIEKAARRYICLVEYYSPQPQTVSYRGHADRLFKRDFAGEMLDRYPHLQLVDYGFCYHRDCYFPQDDVTWFLLEKTSGP
jgi:pseudaminic acid biosynthesis-associated methylase